jgi:DNA repair protein RecN (Recombination protein N)
LIDVHSQHQNLLLNHEDFQLNVLDILANSREALQTYKSLYNSYKQTARELNTLIEEAEKNRQDEEYIRFQVQQLEDAHLQAGEQEELEQELEMLTHAEDIKSSLFKVNQLMDEGEMNLVSLSKEAMQVLQSISRVYAPASEWSNRLESCYLELKDMAHEIAYASDEIEFNPTRLDYVNERLNLIYTLQQKHQLSSVEELLELAGKLNEKLDAITSSDDHIQELTQKKDLLYQQVLSQAEVLTRMRTEASKEIEAQMQAYLIPLGMPNVRFAVELSPRKEPDASGMDNVSFLFSANKNGTLQQVASIASGGEIARVMLSLKAMIAGAVKLPTIIFDEIDTGVSGSIAEKMALIMQEMGQADRQVISITHLPQIAARGAHHYKVYKEDTEVGTNSHIRILNEEERINEIAHMLSGATLTEAALNNAKALLNNEIL